MDSNGKAFVDGKLPAVVVVRRRSACGWCGCGENIEKQKSE